MGKLDKNTIQVVALVAGLYLIGRFGGGFLFDNNWSLVQLNKISFWYSVLWSVVGVAVVWGVRNFSERIDHLVQPRNRTVYSLVGLLVLLYLFRFDSFLYGGANLLVDQLAIKNSAVLRWYELGAMGMVTALYQLLQWFGFLFGEDTLYRLRLAAGVNGIVAFSFVCTAMSMWGAAMTARILCTDKERGCWTVFLVLFLGPQALMYFGYVGLEPVVIPFTIWAAFFIIRLSRQFNLMNLGIIWLLQIVAIIFWFPLIYLLPSIVFATFASLFRAQRQAAISYIASAAALIIMLILVYVISSNDFWSSQFILYSTGTMPHLDYGLLSGRHIGDFIQSIWLLFPQILLIGWLMYRKQLVLQGKAAGAFLIMSFSGLITLFILNPINSAPLDLPRFSAYLTPLSILIGTLLSLSISQNRLGLSKVFAAFALIVPIGLLPSYVSIVNSEAYIDEYFNKHDQFSLVGLHAYRDAYFYNKDFDRANEWEWQLPKRSDDYLNYQGCVELVNGGKVSDAMSVLPRIILQHPYWTEPRALLATIHMNAGRYALARPQIDTCIMAEPYDAAHYQMLYRCLRDDNLYAEALAAIKRADELSPNNPDILIDLMVGNQFLGDLGAAETMADRVLAIDSSQAFAFAMKGFIAEGQGRDSEAMKYYERFILLAPDDPESMKIRKRLNALVNKSRENDGR